MKNKTKQAQIRPNLEIRRSQLISGVLAIAILLGILILLSSRASTPPNRFVDCAASGSGNGSKAAPWTLAQANLATLTAGQNLLLKRGCVFASGLTVRTSGISIGNYGDGNRPKLTRPIGQVSASAVTAAATSGSIINITASNSIIDGINIAGPGGGCNGCTLNGVSFSPGANNNTLRNSSITGMYAGVYLRDGANGNHITNNQINGNTMMNLRPGPADDAGAFGILLHGNDNEIAYNRLDNNIGASFDYCHDGGAVEIFNGSRNRIHHNWSFGSNNFSEMGKDSSHSVDGNIYAYNQYSAGHFDAVFLNLRGAGSNYGPDTNTRAYNNVAYLPGPTQFCGGTGSNKTQGPQGIVCSSGCNGSILTARNNIMVAGWKAVYADGGFNESNNIFWGGQVQGISLGPGSRFVDPKFVNPGGGDFHLQTGSPARDAGSSESVAYGFNTDLDGRAITGTVDIGNYQGPVPEARRLVVNSSGKGYLLDSWGKVWPLNGAPASQSPYWPNWNIARGLAADVTNFNGGFVLDGWGGIHNLKMGSKSYPPASGFAYWPNWDIARDIAVYNFAGPQGYVLDGWGGIHPFGGAVSHGNPYWPGNDVARRMTFAPGGYYVLDMSGGVHAFGTAAKNGGDPYWPGADIARALVVRNNDSTGKSNQGYMLDRQGGIHPVSFGAAGKPPPVSGAPYWNSDVAKDLVITNWSVPSGYVLDFKGGVHNFGGAPKITGGPYWP